MKENKDKERKDGIRDHMENWDHRVKQGQWEEYTVLELAKARHFSKIKDK